MKKLVLTGSVAKEAAIKYVNDAPLGYVFQIGEPIKKREQEENSNNSAKGSHNGQDQPYRNAPA